MISYIIMNFINYNNKEYIEGNYIFYFLIYLKNKKLFYLDWININTFCYYMLVKVY